MAGGGVMALWYFLLGPALAQAGGELVLLLESPILFTILDLVVIFGICAVLFRGATTTARVPLYLVLATAGSNLVADVVVGDLTISYPQYARLATEVWYVVGVTIPLLLLLAAAIRQCQLAGQDDVRNPPRELRRPTWLPYAALVLGFVLLAWAAAMAPANPWWGLVAGAIVMTAAVAGRQIIALRENQELVLTDGLTGLANRLHLRETMDRLARRNTLIAVLQIDLDGFKKVNDAFGHDTGDALLTVFAAVLRRNVRGGDVAVRLGGDEFAILLNGVVTVDEAIGVANRILEEAARPTTVGRHRLPMRASVGIAMAASADLDADHVLRQADQAMYMAKRQRTHSWKLFADGATYDDHDAARRMVAEAVRASQLRLSYQPIHELTTGDLVAVQALVRWQHPTWGLLPHADFIPLAEEGDAIREVSLWVIDEAARAVVGWRERLPNGRRLQLSLNLSPRLLSHESLAVDILRILQRRGLPPQDFVADLTEGATMDGVAVLQLQRLRARGARVALDDFVTGFSTLLHRTCLPVDILKVDRCFVSQLDGSIDRSVVAQAVVRLARMTHLDTVAEGIEDRRHAVGFSGSGYHHSQGFHHAPPLTSADIDRLLGLGDEWPNLAPASSAEIGTSPGGTYQGP